MTKYTFSESSIKWLKENKFADEEIDQLQHILNMIEAHKDGSIRLPKTVTEKVSTLAYLLDSITDAEGLPICFEESGLIEIPDEAMHYFEEDLELEELERVSTKLKKVKFARRYSYPKRRGTMKQDRYPLD